MTPKLKKKLETLRRRFREMESAVVAFSGGVDSSVLIWIASQELKDRAYAATAVSPSLPDSDRLLVKKFCEKKGVSHAFVETREFEDPIFTANSEDRCYHCKRHLFRVLIGLADDLGFKYVIEGTNASDLSGHRPGFKASQEFERVQTPLVDAGITKDEVREIARELKLPNAAKPSAACLSSRIPTGVALSAELLKRIDRAEDLMRKMGVSQVRVRHHGPLARIEVEAADMATCLKKKDKISSGLKKIGWDFVALDLMGYRTGGTRA